MKPNIYRNHIIYQLWEKGLTVDEIKFETGIPRSTVGYYVRKFNMYARKGQPIAYPLGEKKPDEKGMAVQAIGKISFLQLIQNTFQEPDGIDKVYKLLMIRKLLKELGPTLELTKEEAQAGIKSLFDFVKQQAATKSTSRN